jgi:hypothetical protein
LTSIETQLQAVLRDAGYATWSWTGGSVPVVCFEDDVVVGFVFVFADAGTLLECWQAAETGVLSAHAPSLRAAGAKAWNVYSVFVTAGGAALPLARSVRQIEENLDRTRKVAAVGVRDREDVIGALLPVLPLASRAVLEEDDMPQRLHARLSDLPTQAVAAFFGLADARDVAQILIEAK